MKKFSLIALLFLSFVAAKAQEEYTDEELTKYATVMVWAANEKATMTDTYNDWIKSSESLGTKMFSDMKKAKGDSVEIAALEASNEEIIAFDMIQAKYDSMTASFKEVYIGKIKEDIGVGLYNRLKASLKSDADVKSRYDVIYEGLKTEEETEDDAE